MVCKKMESEREGGADKKKKKTCTYGQLDQSLHGWHVENASLLSKKCQLKILFGPRLCAG